MTQGDGGVTYCGCGKPIAIETVTESISLRYKVGCHSCGVWTRRYHNKAEAVQCFQRATRAQAVDLLREVMVFLSLIDERHHPSDRCDVDILRERITAYLEDNQHG